MKDYAMHLFRLGDRLANALGGDKQAMADLQLLYKRYPEMFANLKDLINTIVSKASLVETPAPSTHRGLPTEGLIAQKYELSGANARSVNPYDNSTKIPKVKIR